MSVVWIVPDAMRGRPAHAGVRRKRIFLPFGATRFVRPGLAMTVFSIVNETGQPTGELEITLRYPGGYTGTFPRAIDARPFDLDYRARFRMIGFATDTAGRPVGLHGEVTEAVSEIPFIA